MANRHVGILVVVFSILFFVNCPAWAVVGDVAITVKDPAGRPVPGAKITLTPSDPALPTKEATTDDDGEAVFLAVAEGSYTALVRSSEHVRADKSVKVRGGETTSTDFSITPIFPWMVQNPAGVLGGFTLGAGYNGEWRDDLRNTLSRTTSTLTLFFPETSETLSETTVVVDDPALVNRDFDFEWHLNAGLAHISVGLPLVRLIENLWIYPAINVEAGGADVHFDVKNKVSPSQSTFFKGSGPMVGVGVDLVATFGSTSQMFFGLGYKFQTIPSMDLDRSPSLGAGFVLDDVSLSYDSHSVSGRIGYSLFNHRIAPFLGIRGNWAKTEVESETQHRIALDNSIVQSTTSSRSEFERHSVEGLAGMDAHFWGPLFGRVEASFTTSDVTVLVNITYGFGFVDP